MRRLYRQGGFTLLELIVAIALFAVLVTICYTALGPASDGFRELSVQRDKLEKLAWIGRQMRLDVAYAVASQDHHVKPFTLQSDRRGDTALDGISFTTHEVGRPGLTQIRYFLTEQHQLIRESLNPWARGGVEPLHWKMGSVESFRVEAMTAGGSWQPSWQADSMPRAIRVTLRDAQGQREWVFPIDAEDASNFLKTVQAKPKGSI